MHAAHAALPITQSVGSLPSQLMLHARLSTPDPMTAVTMWAYAVSQPPVREFRSVPVCACSLPGSWRGNRWKLSCKSPISQGRSVGAVLSLRHISRAGLCQLTCPSHMPVIIITLHVCRVSHTVRGCPALPV